MDSLHPKKRKQEDVIKLVYGKLKCNQPPSEILIEALLTDKK